MRLFGAVVIIAGLVWLMVGCGTAIVPVAGGAASGLMLADAESGLHYELRVTDGALTLTGTGNSGTSAKDAELVDDVTGASYEVGVAGGALTLAPGGAAGAKQIGLEDAVTAKTFELVVADGALTLIPKDGGAQ
jgi:hypothetical protein